MAKIRFPRPVRCLGDCGTYVQSGYVAPGTRVVLFGAGAVELRGHRSMQRCAQCYQKYNLRQQSERRSKMRADARDARERAKETAAATVAARKAAQAASKAAALLAAAPELPPDGPRTAALRKSVLQLAETAGFELRADLSAEELIVSRHILRRYIPHWQRVYLLELDILSHG